MQKPRTNKSTIKNDPFASVIPMPAELELPEVTVEPTTIAELQPVPQLPTRQAVNVDKPRERKPAIVPGKQKLTVHLDAELADRVKNAAWWNPKLTIAGIAEQGIRHAIEKHEREHGGKYPPREGELLGGRPIK